MRLLRAGTLWWKEKAPRGELGSQGTLDSGMPVPIHFVVDFEDIYEFGQAIQGMHVHHYRAFEKSANKDNTELVEWISGMCTGCE